MVISQIQSDILAVEADKSLYEEANFNMRAEALDYIDFHIIDRIEGLVQKEGIKEELDLLAIRANKLKARLDKIDVKLFLQLRKQIRTTNNKASLFKEFIYKYLGTWISDIDSSSKIGYDNLDVFINGLLSNKQTPEPTKERESEMVFYQQTPARIIFEMLASAKLKQDDVFFDLGSGLGQVVILMNMLGGITAKGIEYEPTYCEYAKASASQLNLSNIGFINADARNSDYSDGTIFFLYTPFEGKMLHDVMILLQKASLKRNIRIFTYGPCSIPVMQLNWLNCVTDETDNIYRLYEFESLLPETA